MVKQVKMAKLSQRNMKASITHLGPSALQNTHENNPDTKA